MVEPITITQAGSHGLTVGAPVVIIDCPLFGWSRFRAWLRRPWRWPPAAADQTFHVIAVTDATSFDVVR